jgi:MYXO-CTERM domain-containing protein
VGQGFKPFVLPLALIVLAGAMLPVVRTADAATTYTISSLSQLANIGIPYGSSANRTKIAGTSFTSGNPAGQLFSAGAVTPTGTVSGYAGSWAFAANDSGQVAGALTVTSTLTATTTRGFYRSGGTNTLMPSLSGTSYTHALDINNAGTIVGISSFKPFVYTIGTNALTQLPTPAGGDGSGSAASINSAGDIVGWAGVSGQRQPARWSGGAGGTGSLLTLPSGATSGEATVLTDDGTILGFASYPGGTRAARYSTTGPGTDLGTLGVHSEPRDANASGQIVGDSLINEGSFIFTYHTFLYENGAMVDLNGLIPQNSGWLLNRALTIDDAGVITGVGRFNGNSAAFVLTPTPEPAGLVALAVAGSLVALRRRRD